METTIIYKFSYLIVLSFQLLLDYPGVSTLVAKQGSGGRGRGDRAEDGKGQWPSYTA